MAYNIVLVSGSYYPNFSATGNCIHQIANCYVSKGHNVYMISRSPNGEETDEFYEGHQICRVTSKRTKDLEMRRRLNEKSLYGRFRIAMNKTYWALSKLFTKSGMEEQLTKAYYAKLEELYNNGLKIDAVVPCCLPIEGVKAGYRFCSKHNIPLFPVLYDRYSESRDFFRFTWTWKLKQKGAEKFEKEVFDYSSLIYYIDNWEPYFDKHKRDNALRVEHPLVVKHAAVEPLALKNPTKINAIYQGEINHQMRPPQAMLTAFSKIGETDKDVSLHVFARGNGVEDVEKAASSNPDAIKFYGSVGKVEADRYYAAANIQIILANRDKEIVSSKIFESVASGYPIVYFYFTEEELSYGLLQKYPLVLCVRQEKAAEEADKIREWMYGNCDKRVDFELVRKAYDDATPDMVVDTSIEILDKGESGDQG
ncbi:MAG: hypothetical protein K5881_03470 [Saccharofermentans sp.]|nr:hypothetical protein [Saccharofermentans sp.]